jgi:hypothetical protein
MGARGRKKMRRHVEHFVHHQHSRQIWLVTFGVLLVSSSVALELALGNTLSRISSGIFIVYAIFLFYRAFISIPAKIRDADRFKTGIEIRPGTNEFE